MTTATKRIPKAQENTYRTWNEVWGDAWGETWRVPFPFAVLRLTQRVAGTAKRRLTSRVPDTTIDFGTSLVWGGEPIRWGKGRKQLTARFTN